MELHTGLGLVIILIQLMTKRGLSDDDIENVISNLREQDQYIDLIQMCEAETVTYSALLAQARSYGQKGRRKKNEN